MQPSPETTAPAPAASSGGRKPLFQLLIRRLIPHSAALAALALFLAAGLAVLDDYGAGIDEDWQRAIAAANVDYILKGGGLPTDHNKFYGVAYEAPLLLAERALGLQDTRGVYLVRHLLTHLFFLTGGLFAYLLASRLFRSRLLATAALLLFLLSPRLYAHSFFNSKDIPFLVMFMITLFLAHRAFRRDTLWSFALLGVGAGLLVNLRIMGVVLFAAVPAMRAVDLLMASGWEERKRTLVATGVFALAGAGAVYATTPYLWADPLARFVEWWATLSSHPSITWQLLGGEPVVTSNPPARYVPVWFSITNSPAVLLLGCVGALAACAMGAGRPRSLLRNTRLRFLCLIAACFLASVLAVVLLKPTIYNGWRQMYFLHAPFSLLAAFGLQWLASSFRRERLRAAVYGATGIGAGAIVLSMALIHPHQQVYFNFLVDRTTSERLRTQYEMDYWGASGLEALRHLLQERPDATVPVFTTVLKRNARLLSQSELRRVAFTEDFAAFHLSDSGSLWGSGATVTDPYAPPAHTRRLYGSALYSIVRFAVDEDAEAPYRATYDALASRDPAIRSVFNVYLEGNSLVYTKEQCAPPDIQRIVFLHAYPKNSAGLSSGVRALGFQNLDFLFRYRGASFDGKCIAVVPLPDYPIARIVTGQPGARSWKGEFTVPDEAAPN